MDELEALRGELEVTASRLASGLCERQVYRLFMDEVKELLLAEDVDPGSHKYETDVAHAQRMYRACLKAIVTGLTGSGRG